MFSAETVVSSVSLSWLQRKKEGDALIRAGSITALKIAVDDPHGDDSDDGESDDEDDYDYDMYSATLTFTLADGSSFNIELHEEEEHGC